MANKVIVRCVQGEEFMALTLRYSSPLIPTREFKFQRRQDETLKTSLDRIAIKIQTIADKKIRKKSKKTQAAEPPAEIFIGLCLNGSAVLNETRAAEAFQTGAVLSVGDDRFQVEVNPPLVKSLALPKHVMAGFVVYPRMEIEFGDKDKCGLSWWRSVSRFNEEGEGANGGKKKTGVDLGKIVWEKVEEGFFYEPGRDDIGRYLKVVCVPGREGCEGPVEEVVCGVEVSGGPENCPFERRHAFTRNATDEKRLGVILACCVVIG